MYNHYLVDGGRALVIADYHPMTSALRSVMVLRLVWFGCQPLAFSGCALPAGQKNNVRIFKNPKDLLEPKKLQEILESDEPPQLGRPLPQALWRWDGVVAPLGASCFMVEYNGDHVIHWTEKAKVLPPSGERVCGVDYECIKRMLLHHCMV